jgi:hypothetical protein
MENVRLMTTKTKLFFSRTLVADYIENLLEQFAVCLTLYTNVGIVEIVKNEIERESVHTEQRFKICELSKAENVFVCVLYTRSKYKLKC